MAVASGLPRPAARRILLTLKQLGYVRHGGAGYELTGQHLPLLLQAAGMVSAGWAAVRAVPQVTVAGGAG